MAATTILEGDKVQKLARTVEESTRSTRESVRFFIEPAPGTLARAKNKRITSSSAAAAQESQACLRRSQRI